MTPLYKQLEFGTATLWLMVRVLKRTFFLIDRRAVISVGHFVFVGLAISALYFILPEWFTKCYLFISSILLWLVIARYSYEIVKEWYFREEVNPKNRAVLITGCDSGFGHHLARRLDSKGFHVFASCLFPHGEGAKKLKEECSNQLQIVELDVTKEESIKDAAKFVKENLGFSELWAIVNNSGIHKGFDVEFTGMDDFVETMDVNAFGLIRVTKAFLPLLRKSKGRVINLTALLGRITIPYLCPYTMSKHAAVAFTECLRQEMEIWGVPVISVEPELFKTPIARTKNVLQRLEDCIEKLSEDIKVDYGESYFKNYRIFYEFPDFAGGSDITPVIDALESAVSFKHPDSVYKPCRNLFVKTVLYINERLPKRVSYLVIHLACCAMGAPTPEAARYAK